jgi:hypothetical protein
MVPHALRQALDFFPRVVVRCGRASHSPPWIARVPRDLPGVDRRIA